MAPFNKKLATAFSRRKSASNALDDNTSISPSTTASSQGFRVLERAEVDNRRNGGRPVIPLGNQSDLRLRGSQASSAFTRVGDADTAASSLRYSSASTVPSSFDTDDPFSPSRQTNMNGRSSLRSPQDSPEPKIEDYNSAKVHHGSKLSRERALTTSSYASTAVPPKLETAIPVGQTVFDDDFENMFTGFGERTSSKTPQTRPLTQSPQTRPLTQPPERAFLRADSEPSIAVRKPVRSDLSYTHSPMRIDTTKSAEAPGPSPDLQLRKSTDQLIVSSSSGPSSPGSPPSVPPHMQYTPAVHSESRRQTRSYSSENETIPAKPADTPGRMSTQSTIVRQDYSPARNTATVNKPSHSRLSSTDSFNASALAYGQSAPQDGPRKMTQKDFEAAKKQEQYDEKMRMRHGNTLNDDDLAEYDDVDDEEDLKKIAKEKERRDAMLSVHRQSVAKSVGREISDMFAPMNLDSSPSATGGAEPPPNNRSSSSPEIVRTQDNHLLQYAHNTPNMQPPNIADYIKKPANQSTPNLLGASRNQSSGDSDEDTPLGILMQAKQYNKDPEALRRISTAGSLARGSASIAPSIHGMPPSTSIRPNSGQSHISRPSSRASKLPAFARRAPLPDDLPLMPGYQQGPTFPQASQTFSPLQQWGASVTAPYTPPVVYQNNFGGQYLAPPQPGVPGAPTLMDGLQQEEKMKKWRNRNGNSAQRTTTLPNMGHPQMFNTPMNMGHMGMPQQMPMQGMGAMGMGMGMSMQQQQMQMHMEMQKLQMQMQAMAMGMPQQPQMPHNMSMPQLPLQAPPTGWNSPGTPGRTPLYGSMNGTSAAPSIAPNLQPPMGTGRKSSMLAPIAASPQLSMVMPATTSGLPTGYAPSIAPSERSNIGIPGRYRPVNTADAVSMAGNITPAITPPLDGRDKEKRGVKAWMKHLGGHDGTEDEYDAEGENEDWASMRKGRMARRRDGM